MSRPYRVLLTLAGVGLSIGITGCRSDGAVTKFNAAPTATIVTPADGATFEEGEAVELLGQASDPDDATTTLSATWLVNAVPVCETAVTGPGETRCTWLATEGATLVELLILDPAGDSATDASTLGVSANLPPDLSLSSPTDGEIFTVDDPIAVTGVVSDDRDAPPDLVFAWTLDGADVDLDGHVDDRGVLSTYLDADVGDHVLVVTATDTDGAEASASVAFSVVEVQTPPTVRIDLPLDGSVVGEGDHVDLLGYVGDAEDAPTDLALTWESDVDGVIAADPADSSGRAAASVDDLSVGTHVLTLTAVDLDGLYTSAGVTITVDGRPTAPGVAISPSDPGTDDDLTVTITSEGLDPEGAPVRNRYEWYRDGVLSSASTSAVLPASATTRGEVWRVDVYPSDGVYEGLPGEATVTVGNTAPSLSAVTLSPDGAAESDTLTCAPATPTDADGDSVSLTYAWTVDGATIGASGSTLAGAFAAGQSVQCLVTPGDGLEDGLTVASNVIVVGNTAPVASGVTLAPGAPGTDDVLTASASGADPDGDAVSWTYAWYVDGALLPVTGPTLDGASWFSRDDVVEVSATPDDGRVDGAPVLSDPVVVVNTPPALAAVTLSPASAEEDTTLTCVTGTVTDADGDVVTLDYTWEVSGVVVGTGATLTGASFDRGDTVRCTVTPSDGLDVGAAVSSSTLTVSNATPVASAVTLSPSPVRTDDVLTATPSATDADGDTITWTYQWFRDGARLSTTTASLDGGTAFAKGQTLTVTATPSDGTTTGTPVSASIVVSNTAPALASASLTPATPHETDNLNCFDGPTSDADRDAVSVTYAWAVNGVRIAATTDVLTGASFSKGDSVQCFITPDDGDEAGAEVASNVVTVQNSVPTSTAVTLTPTSPATNDVITAVATATDDDGDALTWTYVWYRDGARLTATGPTLNGAAWFSKGQSIEVVVTPTDGSASGPTVRSSAVTVVNTPPGAPVVEIQPVDPIEAEDDLRCVVTTAASDADGDAVSYAATWTVDGSAFGGSTTTTFSGDSVSMDDLVAEEEWTCLVTATDTSSATATATDSVFVLGDPVNYGQVQYPCSGSAAAGAAFDVYVWVYEPAVTQGVGQGLGIDVEVGVGPDASDPAADAGWSWYSAAYNADKDGPYPGDDANDEYRGTLVAPSAPGAYDYAARATTDHGLSYVYIDLGGDTCHLVGTTDGYEPTTAGALTVY